MTGPGARSIPPPLWVRYQRAKGRPRYATRRACAPWWMAKYTLGVIARSGSQAGATFIAEGRGLLEKTCEELFFTTMLPRRASQARTRFERHRRPAISRIVTGATP